jgi:crossover junction endodeoxyribonuclease RuvC
MLLLGRSHLEQVLREYVGHYNSARPHRALQLRAPLARGQPTRPGACATRVIRRDRLGGLIHEYEPVAMAIEDLYFGRNAHSAFAVGQARGVVMLSAGMAGIPCFSYTPQVVKQAVCGTGGAGKEQVQRMVGALLSLPELPRPDHAADALAVAICHANSAPLKEALG